MDIKGAALDGAVFITPSVECTDLCKAAKESWQLSALDKKTAAIKEPTSGQLNLAEDDPYQSKKAASNPVVDDKIKLSKLDAGENPDPKLEKMEAIEKLEKLGKLEPKEKFDKMDRGAAIGKSAMDLGTALGKSAVKSENHLGEAKHPDKNFIDKSKLNSDEVIILKKKLAALAEEKQGHLTKGEKDFEKHPTKKIDELPEKNEHKKTVEDGRQKIYPDGSIGKILKDGYPEKAEKLPYYYDDGKPSVYESKKGFDPDGKELHKLTPEEIKKLEELKKQKQ